MQRSMLPALRLADQRLDEARGRRSDLVLWLAVALLLGGTLLGHLGGGHHAGFQTVNQLASILPDGLWSLITRVGDERVLLALSLLLARHRPEIFWALLLAALFGVMYSRGLKPLVDALRPPAVLPPDSFFLIGPGHQRHSWPSGHTLSAFVAAGVLVLFFRDWRIRTALIGVAALVAVSRVAVGVHWPQDTIAGAVGGLLAAWLGTQLALRWRAGLRPSVHLVLVLLPVLAAIDLFFNDGGYPATRVVAGLIGFAMLTQFANDYLPLLWRRR